MAVSGGRGGNCSREQPPLRYEDNLSGHGKSDKNRKGGTRGFDATGKPADRHQETERIRTRSFYPPASSQPGPAEITNYSASRAAGTSIQAIGVRQAGSQPAKHNGNI